MKKLSFLVTAGPTREFIDPFRFISNPSSGKMGYEIAYAAYEKGFEVLLISGPVNMAVADKNIKVIPVVSAVQMRDAVLQNIHRFDVLIMAAAVSDYRPHQYNENKIKKSDASITIILDKNPDILNEVNKSGYSGIKVGFAAETENLTDYALDKLHRKKLNLIVANDISKQGAGFESETNAVSIFSDTHNRVDIPLAPKREIAVFLIDYIVEYIRRNKKVV